MLILVASPFQEIFHHVHRHITAVQVVGIDSGHKQDGGPIIRFDVTGKDSHAWP